MSVDTATSSASKTPLFSTKVTPALTGISIMTEASNSKSNTVASRTTSFGTATPHGTSFTAFCVTATTTGGLNFNLGSSAAANAAVIAPCTFKATTETTPALGAYNFTQGTSSAIHRVIGDGRMAAHYSSAGRTAKCVSPLTTSSVPGVTSGFSFVGGASSVTRRWSGIAVGGATRKPSFIAETGSPAEGTTLEEDRQRVTVGVESAKGEYGKGKTFLILFLAL